MAARRQTAFSLNLNINEIQLDPAKALANIAKHGVSFEEAASVFGDPLSDTYDDPDHSTDERRFIMIGYSKSGKLLFVSHSDEGERIRIISARILTRSEKKQYEEGHAK